MSSSQVIGRILERAKALGLSPRAASLKAGMSDSAIRDMIRRPGNSPTLDTIAKLAVALETTPGWLSYGTDAEEPTEVRPQDQSSVREVSAKFVRAIYGGIVEAGSFRPIDDFDDEAHVRAPIWEYVDPEFPDATIVVFDVSGDSMNALKPHPLLDGFRVACLDFESLRNRAPVRDGMVVVVEQTVNGGQLRERSVKQMEIYRDRTEFCPRSSNLKHKPIVIPRERDADDGRDVTILAIVRRVSIDVRI